MLCLTILCSRSPNIVVHRHWTHIINRRTHLLVNRCARSIYYHDRIHSLFSSWIIIYTHFPFRSLRAKSFLFRIIFAKSCSNVRRQFIWDRLRAFICLKKFRVIILLFLWSSLLKTRRSSIIGTVWCTRQPKSKTAERMRCAGSKVCHITKALLKGEYWTRILERLPSYESPSIYCDRKMASDPASFYSLSPRSVHCSSIRWQL